MKKNDKMFPQNENLTMMDILGVREEIRKEINFEELSEEVQKELRDAHERYKKLIINQLNEYEKRILGY